MSSCQFWAGLYCSKHLRPGRVIGYTDEEENTNSPFLLREMDLSLLLQQVCNDFPSGELILMTVPEILQGPSPQMFFTHVRVLVSNTQACPFLVPIELPLSISYSSHAVLISLPRVGLQDFNKLSMYQMPKSSSLNLCSIIY